MPHLSIFLFSLAKNIILCHLRWVRDGYGEAAAIMLGLEEAISKQFVDALEPDRMREPPWTCTTTK